MKFIKIFAGIGFGIALLLVIVIVIKQMRDVATDSGDATLASKVHEQLATCFEDKKAYPASLDTIWNQKGMLEYFKKYGITRERLDKARKSKDIVVMHPGPINRGIEISSEVADGPNSVILEQVTNGIAVRMAVLYLVSYAKEA